MSTPGDLSTLSDAFLAHVAVAALKRSTARVLRETLEEKLRVHSNVLSSAKAEDVRVVIEWLKKNEGAA